MSIIDTLIIDRTQADAELARRLGAIGWAAMTDEQRALYLSDQLKGAYKASDLNRVNAAMDYLVGRLKSRGINVELKRSKIPHKASGSGSRLPEGFTELAYIESTGTQWIDTGFVANQDSRVVMDVSELPITDATCYAFGGRTSSSSNPFAFAVVKGSAYRSDYNGKQASFASSVNYTGRFTIDKNKNVTTLNNNESVTGTYATFTSAYSIGLFAMNTAGTASNLAQYRMYGCQIYDNGTLVRDYIPCKNASGEIGLYDMVNGVFYGNSGTGVFYGAEARKLPEGYIQTEYIEGSATQYINTGVNPKFDTRIVMDVSHVANTDRFMYGAKTADGIVANQYALLIRNATSVRSDYFGTSATATIASLATRTTLDQNGAVFKGWEQTINGTSVSSGEVPYPMYLFSVNLANTSKYPLGMRLYSCQIYDTGALVRDYVPCINSSGVAGLYDLVNGVFYANAGTGTFAVGGSVYPIEWEPVGEVVVYDDFTWYDSDIPTPALLTEHMANVATVRGSLRAALPEIPADVDDGLTVEEANNIEVVLVTIELFITNMLATYRHCGVTVSGMGGLFF